MEMEKEEMRNEELERREMTDDRGFPPDFESNQIPVDFRCFHLDRFNLSRVLCLTLCTSHTCIIPLFYYPLFLLAFYSLSCLSLFPVYYYW